MMSRFLQIDIRLLAAYGSGGLKAQFPHLTQFLTRSGYYRLLEEEPSVYHLVDGLIRIQNDPNVASREKKPLEALLDRIRKTRDEARELLLARRLSELDQVLYRLEDLFLDLERDLGSD
jgi:hypothetical protein